MAGPRIGNTAQIFPLVPAVAVPGRLSQGSRLVRAWLALQPEHGHEITPNLRAVTVIRHTVMDSQAPIWPNFQSIYSNLLVSVGNK